MFTNFASSWWPGRVAKGHQQSEILTGALTKVSLTQNGKGLIGEHFIAEFNDSQAFTVPEPDTIVRMKITRDAESSIDTFYGLVAAFIVDIHYESDHNSTIGRLPNFDVITGAKWWFLNIKHFQFLKKFN